MLALPPSIALGCYVVGITIAARLEHKNGVMPAASSMLALALLYTPGIVFAMRFASAGGYPMQLVILAAFGHVLQVRAGARITDRRDVAIVVLEVAG